MTSFRLLINGLECKTKHTITESADDAKLWEEANTMECMDSIQRGQICWRNGQKETYNSTKANVKSCSWVE